MHKESHRLAQNQRTLLETLPGIVLVVTPDFSIEYLNPPAKKFFRDSSARKTEELQRNLALMLSEGKTTEIFKINNHQFECRVAPFAGFKGDSLSWVVLKESVASHPHDTPAAQEKPENRLIGSSAVMGNLYDLSIQFAKTDVTILVTGESGTGKELVANLIQRNSQRKNKPFLAINCSAISDLLLESDLFGYEKGSFTGAYARKIGKFEAVEGGTLFLDEIGEISPRMQAALLRVLQHGEIIRVGGTYPIKVDVRIIAATNRNLVEAVKAGTFRMDLFYRISIAKIVVPPLSDHKEDLPELMHYFVNKYCTLFGREVNFDYESVLQKLACHDWPGNVRELENVIQRSILTGHDRTVTGKAISFDTSIEHDHAKALATMIKTFNGKTLKKIVNQVEKEIILEKLAKNGGNVADTAEKLDICKAALYEKMKRFGISAKATRKY